MRLFGRKSSAAEPERLEATATVSVPDSGAAAGVVGDAVPASGFNDGAAAAPSEPEPSAEPAAAEPVAEVPSVDVSQLVGTSPSAITMSPSTAARLAFLEKGTAMTSSSPKPPAASFLSGAPRGDISPRRVLDTPALGGGVSGGGLATGGLGRPGIPVPSAAAPAPAPVSEAALADVEPQRRLIVGRNISLCGEIASCEVLVVEGTVEAKLRDGRSIEVTEGGLFRGSVEIDEADIGGTFNGDILVRHRLRVRSTGRITGSIVYGELEVESGGQLDGSIRRYDPSAQPAVNNGESFETF